ncbi:methylamine utilization protein MauE [Tumebacillus sp. BK434]|uniref:MauE/DoxX family redox-associated membrane protein n=1 Tax=Tumebacillus sp. BK434 TaxID=2512169 RepID=UPI00104AB4FC|nr:MauE/DoxX family redox-associated membrane protein [Tumebacillus sp. BK434]TCP57654.1 methylamine utilization protein MauE [Tumebacillus sp. BK434]
MDVFVLLVRVLLAGMFLSAGLSKRKQIDEHIAIVKEYRILPGKWVSSFVKLEIAFEVLAGVLLIVGILTSLSLVLALLLFTSYTIAIVVNLLRGRNEISCGCGGVAGNHKISWWLVVRNAVLMMGSASALYTGSALGNVQSLLEGQKWSAIYGYEYFMILLAAVVVLMTYLLLTDLIGVGKRMNQLFEE